MYLGEIVEIGPRDAVLGDPRHPYPRKLIATVPTPDPARRREAVPLDVEEIRSPVRPLDWRPPARHLVEVGQEHFVLE